MCYDEELSMLMRYIGKYLITSKTRQVVMYTLKNAVTCCSDLRPGAVSLVNEEVFKNCVTVFTTNEGMNE